MVSDVTVTGVVQDAQKTQAQSIKLAEDFDQFLVLLTTQLQNQDPMNPMDSTEFTNQLVQFSQVEQAINTNQKLDDLVSLQLGSISSVALGYVGLDASYISSEASYDGAAPVKVSYALEETSSQAKINIYDEKGGLVFTKDVNKEAGAHEFVWDGSHVGGGKVEAGTYTISLDALNHEGKPIDTSTVVSGRVRGIESQNGIIYLLIGERAVPLGQVINATLPEEPVEEETI
ncbi:MAG: flagellar hook capping family protein [Alphaproteobacteria bacterium CG_4_9_14_3_um_filter_47_13]|nr:MAG: flagellar hook capping family protein [Alphaproteobacteria bacterium CG_4_9_14_3_um_filter_47_13]